METVRNRLSLLLDLTGVLAECMVIDQIAGFVLGAGRDAVDANRGTLCLMSARPGWLEVVGHVGYDPEMMSSWEQFELEAELPASDAVRSREAVYLHSPAERAARYPMFAGVGGDGASVMLPLVVRGEALGALVFGFDGERRFDDDDRSFLAALATQCATAVDRARLYEASLHRQASLSMLVEVASVLAAAGADLDGALERAADLAARVIADIVSVHVLDSPMTSRLVVTKVAGGAGTDAVRRVNSYGADLDAADGLGRALRTGVEVVWDDGPEFVDRIAREDAHRSALEQLGLGGGIIVPMVAAGQILGACVFANHSDRPMMSDDRQMARTLAERAAVLIHNSQLMQQRMMISETLQGALLAPPLPSIANFDLGARYQPAGDGVDVGGDFYDVVRTGDAWLLVVGDVTGHDVAAAAVTGQVRHSIRSAAILGMRPPEILEHVNRVLLQNSATNVNPGAFCTLALALVPAADPLSSLTGVEVVASCAGHPAPLIRRADGSVERVTAAAGKLLGFFEQVGAAEASIDLQCGDTLILFTDGVIERRCGNEWFDENDLVRLLESTQDLSADALAELIRDEVSSAFDSAPEDDVAILVLRRTR